MRAGTSSRAFTQDGGEGGGADRTLLQSDEGFGAPPACSRSIAAWMNLDQRVRMLLTRAGRVQWANDAAYRAMAEGSGFRWGDGVLTADSQLGSALLARLLEDAALEGPIHAILPSAGGRQWLLWIKQLVRGDDDSIGLAANRVAEPVAYDAMLRLHRLTPSETRIVSMMLTGMETGRIAQRQDISIETLRTHVKHAYRKLEVKNRGELFAKAVDFARL